MRERLAGKKRRRGPRVDTEAMMTIVGRIDALSTLDDWWPDAAIGYEEQGLPT